MSAALVASEQGFPGERVVREQRATPLNQDPRL